MNAPGYNPMRWNCDYQGCYNVKHRPKIEVFAECLPGKNAFTDVDGTAEINGHFLFLEFKGGDRRELPTGQRIYLERLTALSRRINAVVICGDAETMDFNTLCVIRHGVVGPWEITNLQALRRRIADWASRARSVARAAA